MSNEKEIVNQAIEGALSAVPEQWQTDFCNFVKDGKAEKGFLDHLDSSKSCQEAVESVFDAQAKVLQGAIGRLDTRSAEQPSIQMEAVESQESHAPPRYVSVVATMLAGIAFLCLAGLTIWSQGRYQLQKVQLADIQSKRDSLLVSRAYSHPDHLHLVSSRLQMDLSPTVTVQDFVTYQVPKDNYILALGEYPNWYQGLRTLSRTHLYREVYALRSTYEERAELSELGARVYNTLGIAAQALWRDAFTNDAKIEVSGVSRSAAELFNDADAYYVKSVERGITLDDEMGQVIALSSRANMYLRQEETRDKALDLLNQARELRPLVPNPLYNLLCYYSLKGNLAKCEELYQEFYSIEASTLTELRVAQGLPKKSRILT